MKKIFTLLTMMLVFAISTWAEDITIDFSTKGYENAQEIASVEQDGITLTFDKGTNKNGPKYYTTGTAIRCYGSNTITASVSGKNITKIVFTFASGEGTNAITAEPGTFETDTWTGNSSNVVFTIGGTSGHRRIQKMVLTVAASGDTRQTTSIDFAGGYKTKFTYGPNGDGVDMPAATVKGQDGNPIAGATVTWDVEKVSGNLALIPSVSGNKINIPNHSYGKLNVTASYAGDATTYQPSSKSYTIDVYKGRMNIAEILYDFENKGEEDWSAGIPTSYWQVIEISGVQPIKATVTYANGAYTYIQDENGYNLLLYGSGLGFTKGQLISGDQGGGELEALYGNLKTYNGLLELEVKENNFMVEGDGQTVTPKTLSDISELGDLSSMNAYLKIENAVYVSADSRNLTFKVGETEFIVRQNWTSVAIDGLEEGATYTLEGMGAVYNDTPQLYLTDFEKTADAPTGIEAITTDELDVNAPIYNTAGQQVNKNYKGVVIQKGKKILVK